MDAKDLFSVAVRVLGLLSFGRGCSDLVLDVFIILNLASVSVISDGYYTTLRWGLIYFFVGLYLLRGAPLIVNFAFPNRKTETEKEVI